MKLSNLQQQTLKVFVTLLGVLGLHLILKDFGYKRIYEDLRGLGWGFFPVAISFVLPFSLLALSWWVLLKDHRKRAPFPYLFFVSLVANAWNNIGPVSKSLGEPTRVLLLSDRVPVRLAVKNTFLFNLTQAMGTLTAFGFGALVAPLLFPLNGAALWITLLSAFVCLTGNFLGVFWILQKTGKISRTHGKKFRKSRHWLAWISHQIRKYARTNPKRYFSSVFLAASARLSEGFVFFLIFSALGSPITLVESLAVDVGRGIADNAFFFIPYQLGSREISLIFVTESILNKAQESAISASLIFRLGEITWILFGFFLGTWLLRGRSLFPKHKAS
jgi:uncharacterized protein (TIRG00374 family)